MKIAHISDLHLGYHSGNKKDKDTRLNLREKDGYDAYFECIEQIIKEKVDLVLCTGDFFHTPSPKPHTIVYAQEGLKRLYENKIPFVNLAGNHDATDSVVDIPANRILHNPYMNMFSYTEPYIVENIGENILLHLVSHHGYIFQKETMDKLKPVEGKFNILCTHGSCFDYEINAILHTEASPREVVIPEKIVSMNWDYTLLGHIHERGWVSSSDGLTDTSNRKQFYGGSLIRRGFSDKECKLGRGWTLWTIENNVMTPTFFNVKQRLQIDKVIYCENRSLDEIENDMVNFFVNEVDLEKEPIIRINLVGITNQQKTQLNWKHLSEYTTKCLSFTTKIKTKEEIKAELTGDSFSFDLIQAYNEYWNLTKDNFEKDSQEYIKGMSDEMLKRGQEIVLSNS